jgi:ornithine carbamoyltransferase
MVISGKLGINFTIITPQELQPDAELVSCCEGLFKASGASFTLSGDSGSVRGAHAIYTDVWASMGEEAIKEERVKLLKPYQVNRELFEKAGEGCIFLHCLPAIREEEVTTEIIDGPQSRVWDEAENRKHTIKAIMLASLGL